MRFEFASALLFDVAELREFALSQTFSCSFWLTSLAYWRITTFSIFFYYYLGAYCFSRLLSTPLVGELFNFLASFFLLKLDTLFIFCFTKGKVCDSFKLYLPYVALSVLTLPFLFGAAPYLMASFPLSRVMTLSIFLPDLDTLFNDALDCTLDNEAFADSTTFSSAQVSLTMALLACSSAQLCSCDSKQCLELSRSKVI